jgi:hypothetical protein
LPFKGTPPLKGHLKFNKAIKKAVIDKYIKDYFIVVRKNRWDELINE